MSLKFPYISTFFYPSILEVLKLWHWPHLYQNFNDFTEILVQANIAVCEYTLALMFHLVHWKCRLVYMGEAEYIKGED